MDWGNVIIVACLLFLAGWLLITGGQVAFLAIDWLLDTSILIGKKIKSLGIYMSVYSKPATAIS